MCKDMSSHFLAFDCNSSFPTPYPKTPNSHTHVIVRNSQDMDKTTFCFVKLKKNGISFFFYVLTLKIPSTFSDLSAHAFQVLQCQPRKCACAKDRQPVKGTMLRRVRIQMFLRREEEVSQQLTLLDNYL